jgi:hypothetical protein
MCDKADYFAFVAASNSDEYGIRSLSSVETCLVLLSADLNSMVPLVFKVSEPKLKLSFTSFRFTSLTTSSLKKPNISLTVSSET